MAVTPLVMVLLIQSFLWSTGQTDEGCVDWIKNGDDVCCERCHPGNRLVRKCGANPKTLCIPCEHGTYTVDKLNPVCTRCTQCVGALVQLEACTATKDTKCGCNEGLACGNDQCSFCVEKCGKGQEPTDDRSCRPCPEGTFNDQNQQKCKPWSTKCPNPNDVYLTNGTAFSDIKCMTTSMKPSHKPEDVEKGGSQVWIVVSTMALTGTFVVIIIIMTYVGLKALRKTKKTKKTVTRTQIIRTPTDDPRTLIAIECSFHEAQQEQGSSTESLDSKESSDRLIA